MQQDSLSSSATAVQPPPPSPPPSSNFPSAAAYPPTFSSTTPAQAAAHLNSHLQPVPAFFHLCELPDILAMVSEMINRLIAYNDRYLCCTCAVLYFILLYFTALYWLYCIALHCTRSPYSFSLLFLCSKIPHFPYSIPLSSSTLTRFHSRAPPGISISDYLRRIVRYASIEKSALLLILIYIDRICEAHRSFTISSLTSHRFIISAITTGSKSISDIYCTNNHFAKVGGISVSNE